MRANEAEAASAESRGAREEEQSKSGGSASDVRTYDLSAHLSPAVESSGGAVRKASVLQQEWIITLRKAVDVALVTAEDRLLLHSL